MNSIALRIRIFIVGVILAVSVVSGFAFEIVIGPPQPPPPAPQENNPPQIFITSPSEGSLVTTPEVMIQGWALDQSPMKVVQFRVENENGIGEYQQTPYASSWSVDINGLTPGTNTVRFQAWDYWGNLAEAALHIYFFEKTPLTVVINGVGIVKPNLNGNILESGKPFKMTEKPAKDYVFAGWTGDVASGDATLNFSMQSNLVVYANFVTNPFVPAAGLYKGSILPIDKGMIVISSFQAKITRTGKFTAKFGWETDKCQLSGSFLADGSYLGFVKRKKKSTLVVHLQLDIAGGTINGVISDGPSGIDPSGQVIASIVDPKAK